MLRRRQEQPSREVPEAREGASVYAGPRETLRKCQRKYLEDECLPPTPGVFREELRGQ